MIKYLHIRNFQSWRELDAEFAPGLNVIIGGGEEGKSCIVRALRWLFYGQPSRGSDVLQSRGSTKSEGYSVSVDCEDGTSFGRERRDSISHWFQLLDRERVSFEGVGSTVPIECQDASNVRPAILDDSSLELNVAMQNEPHFLLDSSTTASTVERRLSGLIDLGYLDKALQRTKTRLDDSKSRLSRVESQLGDVELSLERYSDLPVMESRLSSVCCDLERLLSQESQLSEIQSFVQLLLNVDEETSNLQRDLDECVISSVRLADLTEQLRESRRLLGLSTKLQGLVEEKLEIDDMLFRASRLSESLGSLSQLFERLQYTSTRYSRVSSLCSELTQASASIDLVTGDLVRLGREESTIRDELIGSLCPLCGSQIDEATFLHRCPV